MSAKTGATDLHELARRIDGGFPPLSASERRIALAVHRCLARCAEPLEATCIARAAGETTKDVEAALAGWPGVYRDDGGRIVGFWGLALQPIMSHRLRARDRDLHTWCAWDTLFLPEILGVDRAEIESVCPATGHPVTLTVTANGVAAPQPQTARLSMIDPERLDVEGEGVVSSFCHHIHFVASAEDGERWIRETGNGAFLLTLDEGWKLGRLTNQLRYGVTLAEASTCTCS